MCSEVCCRGTTRSCVLSSERAKWTANFKSNIQDLYTRNSNIYKSKKNETIKHPNQFAGKEQYTHKTMQYSAGKDQTAAQTRPLAGLSNSMLSERLGTNEQLQLVSGSRKAEAQLREAMSDCWELGQATAGVGAEVLTRWGLQDCRCSPHWLAHTFNTIES